MVSHESDGAVRSFTDDGNPEVMVTSSAASVFSGRKGVAVRKVGGSDGTRTRGLLRDRQAF